MKNLIEGYLIKRKDGVYRYSNTGIYETLAGAKVALKHRQELYRKYDWGDEWEDAVIVKAYVCTDDEVVE